MSIKDSPLPCTGDGLVVQSVEVLNIRNQISYANGGAPFFKYVFLIFVSIAFGSLLVSIAFGSLLNT